MKRRLPKYSVICGAVQKKTIEQNHLFITYVPMGDVLLYALEIETIIAALRLYSHINDLDLNELIIHLKEAKKEMIEDHKGAK
jgi:hypothetical protein